MYFQHGVWRMKVINIILGASLKLNFLLLSQKKKTKISKSNLFNLKHFITSITFNFVNSWWRKKRRKNKILNTFNRSYQKVISYLRDF